MYCVFPNVACAEDGQSEEGQLSMEGTDDEEIEKVCIQQTFLANSHLYYIST